jgi:NADPH:quinone reductase-like Zn-dependent oxidoreductase
LRAAGADIVLTGTPESVTAAGAEIGDAPVPLALDGVGGPSSENVATVFSPGVVLIAYSAVSGAPLWVPLGALAALGVTVRGFSVGAWDFATKVAPTAREAAEFVATGALGIPIAGIFTLDQISLALDRLDKGGKVLLKIAHVTPDAWPASVVALLIAGCARATREGAYRYPDIMAG